jgi:hypothetical protein
MFDEASRAMVTVLCWYVSHPGCRVVRGSAPWHDMWRLQVAAVGRTAPSTHGSVS